jgi:hypothetical protein
MLYHTHTPALHGKWNNIRSEIRRTWGKISVPELDATRGDGEAIGSLIHQKYGEDPENYGNQLTKILKQFEVKKKKEAQRAKTEFRLSE